MRFQELLDKRNIKLSEEQRRAVEASRSAIVSAGAGSGKTTVLSLRFVRLVMDRLANADEILTLTFTKKAAAEMYERIYRLLKDAAEDDEYIAMQLEKHFPKARISTLDSFWGDIARTDCLRYGIMKDFAVLEGDDAEDLAREIFQKMSNDESLISVAEHISEERLLSELIRIAADHSDIVTPFSAERNIAAAEKYLSLVSSYVSASFSGVIDALSEVNIPGNPFFDEISEVVRGFSEGVIPKEKFNRNKVRKAEYRELSSVLERYNELVTGFSWYGYGNVMEYAEALSHVIEGFVKRLQEAKRRRGQITFHDTEVLSKMTLLSNRDVRTWYKNRFRYIMVDEFQDNNSSQRDLLYLLSEKEDLFTPGVPPVSSVNPDKLFFVGDDKQSIYYFRGADVSVFRALKEDIRKMGGEVLSLTCNYRSEPELISWFSDLFSSVFQHQLGSDEEAEEALLSSFTGIPYTSFYADYDQIGARAKSPGTLPRIILAKLPAESKADETTATKEDSEAIYAADLIERMTGSDEFLVPDGKGGVRRPRLQDIAVLFSASSGQRSFEKIFRMRDISYIVGESASITLEAIAGDIYSFLQLAVYPEDRISYLALLRSPFARISDKGLLILADRKDTIIPFEDTFPDPADREAAEALKALYDKVVSMAGKDTIAHILDTIYYEGGYHSYLVSRNDLAVYEDHFSYLWSAAARFDERGKSLPLFLDYIRPMLGQAEKLSNVSIQHFESDAVSLMTVHKSKGLQFPIVILADACRSGSGRTSQNKLAALPSLLMIDPEERGCYPFSALINRARTRREEAEKDRLLYVALTRASVHLVVTGVERQRSSGGLFAKIESVYPDTEIIPLADALQYREYSGEPSRWYESPCYERGVYTERRIGVRSSVIKDLGDAGRKGRILPDLPSDPIIRAHGLFAEFGTMVHEAVEAGIEGRDPSFASLTVDDESYNALVKDALDIRDRFLDSLFYKENVKDRETECELRFYYPDGDMVLEGSADLVVYREEDILIIDFKTDRIMCPEEHAAQLMSYAKAISEIKGKRCRAELLYLRSMERSGVIAEA